jgi:hypothetical protein
VKQILNIAISLAILAFETRAAESMKWLAPSGNRAFELSYGKAGEPLLTLVSNNQSSQVIESPLIATPISREFGGITWFADATSKWIDGRYLAFESDDRLALLDAESTQMILNTSFEALSKAPSGDKWSAVRYRPVGRHQERLNDDFRDTLFVIDLQQVIKANASANESSKPFDHLKSVKLSGKALTKPVWMKVAGNERIAIGLWAGGQATAVALNADSLDVIEQKPLSNTVNDEVASSPWINRDAEQEIVKAMLVTLSESATSSAKSLPPSVKSAPTPKAPEAKSSQTLSKEPGSSTPWIVIVILTVAGLGLLWLLLKRRP